LIHFYKRMESDFANSLVYEYLKTVNNKTAKLFKKHKRIKEELPPKFPTIADVVTYYFSEGAPDIRHTVTDIDKKKGESRKRNAESLEPESKDSKFASSEGRKIYIKNLSKKCVYDDLRERVEKFGEVVKFLNSGRGFGFLTFKTADSASACNLALNNTRVGKKIVKSNIDKEKTTVATSVPVSATPAKETFVKRVEGCTLFVNGVKQSVENTSLSEVFEKCGTVTKALNTGKGYAFVTFSSPDEASDALKTFNGSEVCGTKISIDISQEGGKAWEIKKEPNRNGIRVYVNNIKKDTSKEDLKSVFKAHGKVTDVLHHNGKDFAFVCFASVKSAEAAVRALHGQIWPKFCEKELECNIARVQKGRKRRKKSNISSVQ